VVIDQVARMLGLSAQDMLTGPTRVAAPAPSEQAPSVRAPATADRVGPKPAAPAGGLSPANAGKPGPVPKVRPPTPPPPRVAASKMEALAAALEATEVDGPPQPDDDFAFVEEVPEPV
jgi:hypothetical protein